MPLNDEKTFIEYGYHITELSRCSKKLVYYACDDCKGLYTRTMSNYSHTLKNKLFKGTFCNSCMIVKPSTKKYSCNENYFAEKSLQACYWAGFIAADGNINKKRNLLQIGLSIIDEIILKSFKDNINFDGVIFKYKSKSRIIASNNKLTDSKECIGMAIVSKQICDDLWNNFKIGPRKSLTHEPPTGLTFEQELAFIIGYIDGDGSIIVLKRNLKYPIKFNIVGTEIFLNWVSSKIKQLSKLDSKINSHKTQSKAYSLQGSDKFAYDVLKYLEVIPVPKLNRKWDKIRNLESSI